MEQQSMADPQSKTDPSANASPNPNSTPDPKSANGHPQGSPNGEAGSESVLMGSDSDAQSESENPLGSARKAVRWSPDLMTESHASTNNNDNSHNLHFDGSNPYVSSSGVPSSSISSSSFKDTMGSVRDMLGRWRTKVGEATRKAEELAGNTWQHLNTGPSFTDAALGRIAQGTKVLAEGGYETIFRQTFETVPDELLENSFACYLSTSAGPVMGILYISTAKLAFCSDNPLSYKSGAQTEWSYYKVVIPLHQLKAVNPSSSRTNTAEKYVQVISVDNHEFWFMGFLSYDGAVKCLQDALQSRDIRSS